MQLRVLRGHGLYAEPQIFLMSGRYFRVGDAHQGT